MTTDTRDDLVREIARLRSIVHRAEAQILSYNTRAGLQILDEVCAPEDHREVKDTAVSGPWTTHGHEIPGVTVAGPGPGRPPVARCGGPGLCSQCAVDAERIRRQAGL